MSLYGRSIFILIYFLSTCPLQAQKLPYISYQYTRYRLPNAWMLQQMQQDKQQPVDGMSREVFVEDSSDEPALKAEEGSACRRSFDGRSGFCTVAYQCLHVVREQREQGIGIDVCSYKKNLPVICCPQVEQHIKDKRISAAMCKQFNDKAKNLNLDAPHTLSGKECVASIPLVVGGSVTRAREFPHMAALGWTTHGLTTNGGSIVDADAAVAHIEITWDCGGALISDLFVLTAAHCAVLGTQPPDIVRLGKRELTAAATTVVAQQSTQQDIKILIIIMHPSYRSSSNYHDIALIKLTKRATLNEHVRPACLWQFPELNMQTLVATGWGRTGFLEPKSDTLLKVNLGLIQHKQCQELYPKERRLPLGLIEQQFCAGYLSGGKDTCQGDSGGPLHVLLPEYNCVNFIVGITSFGKFCAAPNSPGVYTKIFAYLNWIEQIVFKV